MVACALFIGLGPGSPSPSSQKRVRGAWSESQGASLSSQSSAPCGPLHAVRSHSLLNHLHTVGRQWPFEHPWAHAHGVWRHLGWYCSALL